MKQYIKKLLFIVAISGLYHSIQAYKESFMNNLNKSVAIAMKYKGSKNLEFIVIQPYENQQFEPGTSAISGVKNAIEINKKDAIPNTWHYLIDPPAIDDNNKNTLAWIPLQFIWLKPDIYKIVLKIAQLINKSDKSAKTVTEIIKSESEKASPEIFQQFTATNYNLGQFITNVGKNIGHSMAQDFHSDIIEDENGNIYFIASL